MGGHETSTFVETRGFPVLHKSNTFSSDEIVKIYF